MGNLKLQRNHVLVLGYKEGWAQSICMRKGVREMWDISGRGLLKVYRRLNLTARWVVRI